MGTEPFERRPQSAKSFKKSGARQLRHFSHRAEVFSILALRSRWMPLVATPFGSWVLLPMSTIVDFLIGRVMDVITLAVWSLTLTLTASSSLVCLLFSTFYYLAYNCLCGCTIRRGVSLAGTPHSSFFFCFQLLLYFQSLIMLGLEPSFPQRVVWALPCVFGQLLRVSEGLEWDSSTCGSCGSLLDSLVPSP